ncbi:MAG TPA: endo-1,4-beta-xylanase [Acetivibrio sp.]|nr:anti-sigma factor domain-containing protein [Clostridium sp.]HOQ36516.1 endo-1,4-beta-xylanase [Acetivibrio sp.]HPT90822.1 endo-1,4-beta-xylanase [Acetivibrio sp.]
MMTGKVIEIDKKTAIVMTDDFAFFSVKARPEMAVGYKFDFEEFDIVKPKPRISAYIPIAACLAVILSIALMIMRGSMGKKDIYAFVAVDINPSIEFSIGRDNQVVGFRNLNRDAKTVTDNLELVGKTVDQALLDVIQRCREHGFIAPERENVVLVSVARNKENQGESGNTKSKGNIDRLVAQMNEILSGLSDSSIEARVIKITDEQRETSLKKDISMGRYAVYLEAIEHNMNLTIEKMRDVNLNDILKYISIDYDKEETVSASPSATQTPYNTPEVEAINTQPPTPDETAPVVPTGTGGSNGSTSSHGESTPIHTSIYTPIHTPAYVVKETATKSVKTYTPKAVATAPMKTPTPRVTPKRTSSGSVWVDNTNAKIDEIRKRDIKITVVDSNNKQMEGVFVEVKQTKHAFAFGTALRRSALDDPNYVKYVKDHFNWAVFENETKWYSNEPTMGYVTYQEADYMYDFCQRNGIKVRGHCIFWEDETKQPPWLGWLDQNSLRIAVDNRLNSVVSHFKGKFAHWDVNNEMIHSSFFKNRLGESIWPYMFKRTKEIDPNVKVFVNNNITTVKEADDCLAQINWLKSQGVQIDGIGVHGHFGERVDRDVVKGILDKLSVANIPIWITEYDSYTSDENRRADNLENLYRTAFSHPSVQGIFIWGFWEGAHWRGREAALVNYDWTLNQAGKRFEALMEEWTTKASGSTDNTGSFYLRGFYGEYEVTLTVPGKGKIVKRFTLNSGKGTLQQTIVID